MTQSRRSRRLFAGSNTPRGFVSFFDQIVPRRDARRFIILKGGPGTGKSTLMRRLAEEGEALGLEVERFHCSSDPDSLDAVFFPRAGFAVVDGTSPHVIDPEFPGAVDEIVHLGLHWDEAGLRAHREEIAALRDEIRRAYRRAYRYLAAARTVQDEIEAVYGELLDWGRVNAMAEELAAEALPQRPPAAAPGRIRRLFAGAVTPKGPLHFLSDAAGGARRVLLITGPPGPARASLVESLVRLAAVRGWDVECFHCPFAPDRVEHAVIPGLGLAVVTSAPPHAWPGRAERVFDAGRALDAGGLGSRRRELKEAEDERSRLFSLAVAALSEARACHARLERYYVPHMDFAAVDGVAALLREKLFSSLPGVS